MHDKETKKRLLHSAKQEFMEQGYLKASLRKICKDAGVTTGALYFFFQDKEELFATIVKEPVNRIMELMQQHYKEEKELANSETILKEDHEDDRLIAKQVIHILYTYKEEFLLVLTKSQGTRYFESVSQFADITQSHYREMADQTVKISGKEPVDEYIVHWVSHMQIDVFVYMLTHVEKEEDAIKFMEPIINFMIGGWYAMFGVQVHPL